MTRLSPADLLSLGSLGLRTRRLRAALSALGIALGIATVIVVTGIPASSQQALLDELTALGTNLLRAQPTQRNENPVLLPESSVAMVQRIGPVTAAAAVANTHTRVRRNDLLDPGHSSDITVLAASPNVLDTVNGHIQTGEFLRRPNFPEVVLGNVAATRLGLQDIREQPAVFVKDKWFTVVGVLAPNPLAPELERAVLVGWEAARTHLGFDGHPTVVYVKAREESIEDVRAVLPATLYGEIPGMVQVSRPSDALAAKRATQNSYSALFLGLAGVAVLIGGVGVANTMVISVLERRSEIGLRRALGATKGHIRAQFLTEAVLLSGLGGLAGTALGTAGVAGYATLHRWPFVIPLPVLAAGVLAAFVVGAAAGLYPSIRAARLTPTQALSA
ncbi:ABC transporter permease [Lentzea nigeriaca]|uniref:ABC transporter permease n=1 Tax=Lentzea nigeriaca TaxID=1128665 RepID=UPI00195965CE|nr:ABC transporter permease [Lentzea nigeriaca]MBM7862324.1 putative ABC transport system permease protein [Lentzea nigeriaca]